MIGGCQPLAITRRLYSRLFLNQHFPSMTDSECTRRLRSRRSHNPYSAANRIHARLLQNGDSDANGGAQCNANITIPLSWLNRRRLPRIWRTGTTAAAVAITETCRAGGFPYCVTAALAENAAVDERESRTIVLPLLTGQADAEQPVCQDEMHESKRHVRREVLLLVKHDAESTNKTTCIANHEIFPISARTGIKVEQQLQADPPPAFKKGMGQNIRRG